jgi:hypothetical protein
LPIDSAGRTFVAEGLLGELGMVHPLTFGLTRESFALN